MELQGQLAALKGRGLGLAAVSYDAPETLKAFADRRGIAFPLLSDAGSAVIKQYGLFNATVQPGGRTYGIPHPGTFMLDPRGEVTARFFEAAYQDRLTVSSIIVRAPGAPAITGASGTELTSMMASVVTYATDEVIAPGTTFSIVADFTVKPRMHVYAPGQKSYIPVSIKLDPSPLLKVRPIVYPPPETFHFKPLNETVKVYGKPFRLVQDVSLVVNQETRALAKSPGVLTITGVLEYQACDDSVCYPPQRIPVSWTVRVKPLE